MRSAACSSTVLSLLLLLVAPASADIAVKDLTQPVSIAGQWKFRLGDDLSWAAADLNDSDWQATAVPAHSPEGHAGYTGMLWYRLTFNLDTSQPSIENNLGALAVTIGKVLSSYELYAGGQKVGGAGRVPPSPVVRNDQQKTYEIPASAVNEKGQLTLALRVWRNPEVLRRWQSGPYAGDFLLGNVGDLRALQMRKALLPNVVLAVLYLVVGLYHLLIARRNPELKEFFWFGLLSIVLALYTFETSQAKFFLDIPFWWQKKFEHLLLYVSPILFSKTLLAVTRTRSNRVLLGFYVVFGLHFLTGLLVPGIDFLSTTLMSFQFIVPVWALYTASLMAWHAYHGSRSARIIVVLLLLLVAGIINDELLTTPLVGSGNVLYIVFALMLFFMALMMAERYTEILKKLEVLVERRTSELVGANQDLAAAVETKGNFLANMSHEMRTPMNAILGLTHLGLKTELTDQQRDYFSKVEQSAEDLQDIINSILDFSKLEDGELECVIEPFNPTEVVEGIRRTWGDTAKETGLELLVEADPKVPATLSGDAQRLKQVLGIFVSNAVKFTESGHVKVELVLLNSSSAFARLRFAVSDTGVGIAEDQRDQLFEAFVQADNTMTRKHGGTGLGLSIAQRLIELMGGRIDVASEQGKGSTFSFELTLPVPDTAAAALDIEGDIDLTPIRGARILLVDDSDLNLQVAGELLRQAKLYVDTASDGRQAVEKVSSTQYDCVLMDVQMPVMDGYTATERIRSRPHLKNLPILAMTANAMPQDRARGLEAGMNAYIPKPIEPGELYQTLLQWIEPGDRAFDKKKFATPADSDEGVVTLPDELPGINIKEGLKRVAGNKALYLDLLKDLCRDYADAPQRLQSMLDDGDSNSAGDLAHKLRGIANNLGAHAVGAAATDIESVAKSGDTVSAEALEKLIAAMDELAGSQAALAPQLAAKKSGAQLDDAQRRKLFDDVVRATDENNPEAFDLIETLLGSISEDAGGYPELTAARDALDIYDFAGASAQLKAASAAGIV